jgi:hypothetical protein
MAGSQLTRVLIDGGSGLNLLFASTLKKTGEQPQPALVELHSTASFRKLGYTTWVSGPASHLQDEGQLPHGVHQVRGGRLRVVVPCYTRQTSIGQIHGHAPLCLSTTQDVKA